MRLYGLSKRASPLHGAKCGICENRPTAKQGRARARAEWKPEARVELWRDAWLEDIDEGEITPDEWRRWWEWPGG